MRIVRTTATTRGKARTPGIEKARDSCDSEPLLHRLQRVFLGLWINEEHDEELQNHHGSEECKRNGARRRGKQREYSRDKRIHNPVREAAETLAASAYTVWK